MGTAEGVVSPVGDVIQNVFHDRQIFEKKKKIGRVPWGNLEEGGFNLKTPDVGNFVGWVSGGVAGFARMRTVQDCLQTDCSNYCKYINGVYLVPMQFIIQLYCI